MPIFRELIFANGTAYSITETIATMADRVQIAQCPVWVYESIVVVLMECRFGSNYDTDDLIEDPSGGFMTLSCFLDEYGFEIGLSMEHPHEIDDDIDDDTVATYSLSDSDLSEFEGEEEITAEEEDMLCGITRI